jgi:hypothetical protein
MPELTIQHLDAIDGEPRILDMTLAECLGFMPVAPYRHETLFPAVASSELVRLKTS